MRRRDEVMLVHTAARLRARLRAARRERRLLPASLVALALASGAHGVAACADENPACHPGDYLACSCATESFGYAACLPDEAAYGPCVCDGRTPGHEAAVEAGADVAVEGGSDT